MGMLVRSLPAICEADLKRRPLNRGRANVRVVLDPRIFFLGATAPPIPSQPLRLVSGIPADAYGLGTPQRPRCVPRRCMPAREMSGDSADKPVCRTTLSA